MTKFVPYKKKNGNQIGVTQLRLVEYGDGVLLIAVDEDGDELHCGQIAEISSIGIELQAGVRESLGFPVGKNSDCIKLVK